MKLFIAFLLFVCVHSNEEKIIPGGWSTLTDIGKIYDLVTFAEHEINVRSNSEYHQKAVQVLKARQQVVAGMKYEIIFDIGTTNCPKFKAQKCSVVLDKPKSTCEAVIWDQPWLNKREILNLECKSEQFPIPGGWIEIKNETKISELMAFAERKINERATSALHQKPIRILKAKQQVVAGMNYNITFELGITDCPKLQGHNCKVNKERGEQTCSVLIFEQPWTNTTELTRFVCNPKEVVEEEIKPERVTGLPGGWFDMRNEDKIHELMTFAERKVNEASNSLYHMKPVRVTKARQQVVAGMKYELSFDVGYTECTKFYGSECPVSTKKGLQTCTILILEQSWLKRREVINLSCEPKH